MNYWNAFLKLNFKNKNGKTFLYENNHKGPILVQKVFYPEKNNCHVYLIHPPGGVVGGDNIKINVEIEKYSNVLITNQGATKFYSSNKLACIKQNFYLKKNSTLEFIPQNNIFFPNAIIKTELKFFIDKKIKLFAWENFCFSNRKINKKFSSNSELVSTIQVWKKEKPLLNEKIRILKGNFSILLSKYYFISTIIVIPGTINLLKIINKIKYKNSIIGSTLIDELLIIRILNTNNINMQELNYKIWKLLRPFILNKKTCKPRIWNT